MIYSATVIGAHSSHEVTLSTPEDLEYVELKVESSGVTRRFEINPCNSMEPTKNITKFRRWMYEVLQDTQDPESVGNYVSEKDVIVNGILGFERKAKVYDKDEYNNFLKEQPSREEFRDKLRYYQRAVLDTWEQEVADGTKEMRAIAKGEVLQKKIGNQVRRIGQ